jgi:uncharacterized protein (DUF934 family)
MATEVIQVIKNGSVTPDRWIHIDEFDELPASGAVTVPLDRFQALSHPILNRTEPFGLRLPNTIGFEDLRGLLDGVALITIDFPRFTDGRGYTLARDLRLRLGYAGELRAVGDVTRDQLLYMARCGFDAFVLKAGKDPHDALEAFDEQDVRYQPAVDQSLPLWRQQSN